MQAKDVMTANVVTATAETPVKDIAKLLLERRISAVPVVDSDSRLIGIVSEGDLLRRPESETEKRRGSWWLDLFADQQTLVTEYAKSHGTKASDVMTRDLVTVTEETTVVEIARILEEKHIKRVPVVCDGRLVGIVSRANLLHGLATSRDKQPSKVSKSDQAIREELLRCLHKEPWGNLPYFNATVSDGVVHLWGVVESSELAGALKIEAESIDGVKSVESHLSQVRPWMYTSE